MKQIIYFKISCVTKEGKKTIEEFDKLLKEANDKAITNVDSGVPGISDSYVRNYGRYVIKWQCEIEGTLQDLQRFIGCWNEIEKEYGEKIYSRFRVTIGELSF